MHQFPMFFYFFTSCRQIVAHNPFTKHIAHIAHHLSHYRIIDRRRMSRLNFHKKSNLYACCRFNGQVLPCSGNTMAYVFLPLLRKTRSRNDLFAQNKAKRVTTLNAYNSLNSAQNRLESNLASYAQAPSGGEISA